MDHRTTSFIAIISILRRRVAHEDRGATMVEYGMMLALVALVALVAVSTFGVSVFELFVIPRLLDALS